MTPDWTAALEDVRGGVRLRARVVPRSARPGVDGLVADGTGRAAVRLRLASPPVEGRANTEAVERLAAALGLARADVELVFGASGRLKVFRLSGLSVSEAARRLAAGSGGDG